MQACGRVQSRPGAVMNMGWSRLVLVLSMGLSACAQLAVEPVEATALFHDEAFAPRPSGVGAEAVFVLSPAMQAFLRGASMQLRRKGAQVGLVDTLMDSGVLRIDYDAELTRTAAEAFDARAGNCLSLVILTAAFAKELGLQVVYQQVETGGMWTRSGTLLLDVAHVNITLERAPAQTRFMNVAGDRITIDFMPDRSLKRARTWPLDERRIVAMYLVNRAVERLAAGHTDEAYWWARAAVEADLTYLESLNALAVIYLRHGRPALAEAPLRRVLQIDPAHRHGLGNLALTLERLGQPQEAAALRAQLRRIEPVQPLRDFDVGEQALAAGDYERARTLFERELRRGAQFHELHMNLARVYWHLKDTDRVRHYLELARENSTTRQQQALYGAKLDTLRQMTLR